MGIKTAVVGGGISGLSIAYKLRKGGNDVTLFESSNTVGGKIGTVYSDGLELDLGPVSIAETPAIKTLANELDLEIIPATEATSIRYIYSNNKLHRASPTSSLLSIGGKLSMLRAPFTGAATEDESVSSYATRRFGNEAYRKLFNPLMSGIYAGNAELLSARSVIKKRTPRKIISLKGGVASLTNAMAKKLNGTIATNTTIDDLNEFDEVYLTTPAFVTAELIRKIDGKLADKLAGIHYSSLSQIFVEAVPGRNKFDGFGFLVPHEEKMSLLGAICVTNIFPSKVPDGRSLFVLFCGGDRPYPFTPSAAGAVNEFNNILQPALSKVLHVQEHKHGIPQFYVGHSGILDHIAAFGKQNPRIRIKGNFVTGVAVGDCI